MAKKIGSFRIPLEVMIIKLTQSLGAVESASDDSSPQKDHIRSEPVLSLAGKKLTSKIKLDNVGALFPGSRKKEPVPQQQETVLEQHVSDAVRAAPDRHDTIEFEQQDSVSAAADTLNFETVFSQWTHLVDRVAKKKMSVGTYLRDSNPVRLKNGILTIGFPKRAVFYKEAVEQKHNQNIIKEEIQAAFHVMLQLKLEFYEEATEKENAHNQDTQYLKSVVDTFNGRIFD